MVSINFFSKFELLLYYCNHNALILVIRFGYLVELLYLDRIKVSSCSLG